MSSSALHSTTPPVLLLVWTKRHFCFRDVVHSTHSLFDLLAQLFQFVVITFHVGYAPPLRAFAFQVSLILVSRRLDSTLLRTTQTFLFLLSIESSFCACSNSSTMLLSPVVVLPVLDSKDALKARS